MYTQYYAQQNPDGPGGQCPNGPDTPGNGIPHPHIFCYWGTYRDVNPPLTAAVYCYFMPTSYSGDNCPSGMNELKWNWGSSGSGGGGGGSGGSSSSATFATTLQPMSISGTPNGYLFALASDPNAGSYTGAPIAPSQSLSPAQQQYENAVMNSGINLHVLRLIPDSNAKVDPSKVGIIPERGFPRYTCDPVGDTAISGHWSVEQGLLETDGQEIIFPVTDNGPLPTTLAMRITQLFPSPES